MHVEFTESILHKQYDILNAVYLYIRYLLICDVLASDGVCNIKALVCISDFTAERIEIQETVQG